MTNELTTRIAELEQALRELRELHRFLATLDAATQPLVAPHDIMQTTARLLAEYLDVDRCAYANVENERVFDITGDWPRGVPSIVGRWEVAAFGQACVTHMLANTPYIVEDTDVDDRIDGALLESYRATTIRAVICVPLHKQGVFTAAMAVHSKVQRHWSPFEVELVTTVVARCWEALERAAVTRTRVSAESALEEHRARLDYAVRLSGVGFWYCDLPFDELQWDERVKAHFWLRPDDRVMIDTFYERIHPDDRERTRTSIGSSIENHASYDVIYRTVDPVTGSVKHIRALGGAAYAIDGTPIRFDGVTLDVTELREQDQRKDEFLATLAHELRNPLAPIGTGLDLLGTSADANAKRTITMMKRQFVHLVRMVDDLLDISRVTLGKVELVVTRTDLGTILDSATEVVRGQIEAAGHRLSVDLGTETLPLDVDPTRIAQVFANLLSNSAKYTPRGGHIRVAVERGQDAWLTIRVTDDGIGMAPDKLPLVFEMFTQFGQSIDRANGGLGIGLTLSRRLVEMHGGTLTAESPGLGLGSTFTLRLRLADDAPARTPREPAVPIRVDRRRILVVDDNIDAAEMLSMLLERGGNEIRVAHTGLAALTVAAEMRPHVVLLDLGLPGIDGYEVARRLRADPSLAQPLLVAVTGWGAEEDRRKAKDAGFDQHLTKPVEYARLLELIATAPE